MVESLKSESLLRANDAFQTYLDEIKGICSYYGIEFEISTLVTEFEVTQNKVEDGAVGRYLDAIKEIERFDTLLVDVIIPNGYTSKPAWDKFKMLLNEPIQESYKPNPEYKCIPRILKLMPELGAGETSKGLKNPVFNEKLQNQKVKEILCSFKKLVTVLNNLKTFYYIPMETITKLHECLVSKATVNIDGLLEVTEGIVKASERASTEALVHAYTSNHIRFAQEFASVSLAVFHATSFIPKLNATNAAETLEKCKADYERVNNGDGSLPSIYTSITKTITDLCILFKEFREFSHSSVQIDCMVDQMLGLGRTIDTDLQQSQDRLVLFKLDPIIGSNGRVLSGGYITDIIVREKGILLFDKFLVILDDKLKFEKQVYLKDCRLRENSGGFIVEYHDTEGIKMDNFQYDLGKPGKKSKCNTALSEEHKKHFISNLRHYIRVESLLQPKQGETFYEENFDEMAVYYKLLETGSISHDFQFKKRNDVAFLLFDENYDLSNVVPSLNSYNVICAIQLCSDNLYKWTCRVQETEHWAVNENKYLLPPSNEQVPVDLDFLQKKLKAVLHNAIAIKETHPLFYTSADIEELAYNLLSLKSSFKPIQPKPPRFRADTQASSFLSDIFGGNHSRLAASVLTKKSMLFGRVRKAVTNVFEKIVPNNLTAEMTSLKLNRVLVIVKYLSQLECSESTGSISAKGKN